MLCLAPKGHCCCPLKSVQQSSGSLHCLKINDHTTVISASGSLADIRNQIAMGILVRRQHSSSLPSGRSGSMRMRALKGRRVSARGEAPGQGAYPRWQAPCRGATNRHRVVPDVSLVIVDALPLASSRRKYRCNPYIWAVELWRPFRALTSRGRPYFPGLRPGLTCCALTGRDPGDSRNGPRQRSTR